MTQMKQTRTNLGCWSLILNNAFSVVKQGPHLMTIFSTCQRRIASSYHIKITWTPTSHPFWDTYTLKFLGTTGAYCALLIEEQLKVFNTTWWRRAIADSTLLRTLPAFIISARNTIKQKLQVLAHYCGYLQLESTAIVLECLISIVNRWGAEILLSRCSMQQNKGVLKLKMINQPQLPAPSY